MAKARRAIGGFWGGCALAAALLAGCGGGESRQIFDASATGDAGDAATPPGPPDGGEAGAGDGRIADARPQTPDSAVVAPDAGGDAATAPPDALVVAPDAADGLIVAPDAADAPDASDAAPNADAAPSANDAQVAAPDAALPACDPAAPPACPLPGCPDDPARRGRARCEGGRVVACLAVDPCNGLDDDCDGAQDEDMPGLGMRCQGINGACHAEGRFACGPAGTPICDAVVPAPGPEICGDGLDQDCDGVADDGCAACQRDADCALPAVCQAGACVEPPPPACASDADCAPGLLCQGGGCLAPPPECLADADCLAPVRCVASRCEAPPPACLPDADEPDDAPGQAFPVALPARLDLSFCDDALDYVSFQAAAGDAVAIFTEGSAPGLDVRLTLLDRDGRTLLAENDDAGPGTREARLPRFVAPVAGRYFVAARAVDARAGADRTYTLRLTPDCQDDAFEDDDTPATARPLAQGAVEVRRHCDVDYAAIAVEAGGRYIVETRALRGAADTVLEVLDAAAGARRVAISDDYQGALSSHVEFDAPAAGTYLVRVGSFGESYGGERGYTLAFRAAGAPACAGAADCAAGEICQAGACVASGLRCEPDAAEQDDAPSAARHLTVGRARRAVDFCDDAADWALFDAVAGTAYDLRTFDLAPATDTVLELYDARGQVLLAADDEGGDAPGASRIAGFVAPQGGPLALRVRSFGGASGAGLGYALFVGPAGVAPPPGCVRDADCGAGALCDAGGCTPAALCWPDAFEDDDAPDTARRVEIGQSLRLNHCDDALDLLRFAGRAGQILDAETTALGAAADTRLELRTADGALLLAESDDGPGVAPASAFRGAVLPADADYLLRVESVGGGAGPDREYTVNLHETCLDDAFEPDDTPAAATPIEVGTTQRRALCADADWAVFHAIAGIDYRIETGGLLGGADTVLELYDAAGEALLATDDDAAGGLASRIAFASPIETDLRVRVRSHGDRYGGLRTYSLTVARNLGRCAIDDDCLPSQICQGGACVAAPPRCVADAFEEDDDAASARALTVGRPQVRDFCDDAADWVALPARAGVAYDLETSGLGVRADTALTLFAPDGQTQLARDGDGGGAGGASRIAAWVAPADGTYLARVENVGGRFGAEREYTLLWREACVDDAAEDDDAPGAAAPLSVVQPPAPRHLCQDADWFAVPLLSDHVYRVETTGLAGGADTRLRVLAPDGTPVGADEDSGGAGASRLDFAARLSGNYLVTVESQDGLYGGPRAYAFDVSEPDLQGTPPLCRQDAECLPGEACQGGHCVLPPGRCRDDADCGAPLHCIDHTCQIVLTCAPDAYEPDEPPGFPPFMTAGGFLDRNFCEGPTDWISVGLLDPGLTYDLFADRLEGAANPALTVFDGALNVLASDDDSGGGRMPLVRDLPAPGGGFRVRLESVGGLNGDAMGYRFGVVEHCDEDVFEPDDTPETAHGIAVDGLPERHALCRGPDVLRLDARAGQTYTIDARSLGGHELALQMTRADGSAVAQVRGGQPGGGARLRHTADRDGPLLIAVTASDGKVGGARAYDLQVYTGCLSDLDCAGGETCVARVCQAPLCRLDAFEPDDAPGEARLVEVGSNAEHTFCDDAEDWVSVDVQAGVGYDIQTYNLTLGTDTVVELYTPDGAQLLAADDDGANWGTASRLSNAVPPFPGRFLIKVRTYSRNFLPGWNYTLNVREHCDDDIFEHDDNAGDAADARLGTGPVAHTLCNGPDYVRFDAVAGQTFRLATSDLQGGADTILTVFDTDGLSAIAESDDRGPGDLSSLVSAFTAPRTGTFFARVRGYNNITGGARAYRLEVSVVP